MPIYEYQCTSCHHHFDLMQKISDEPAKQCPVCFEHTVIKLISAAGFQLKGTGWYATDFKTKKPVNSDEKANANASAKSSETPAKTDVVPPKKTETTKTKKGDSE
ncbi:MAG TPA: zinc ribbon domain-containing protein [Legionella sp.]|nr:zinc ribbon domain-containing protein [Legionella sp.]